MVCGQRQVGKRGEFYDFLVFMTTRTGQEWKYNEIADAIGVSMPTAKEGVSILEKLGIIYILRPYYSNIAKRLENTQGLFYGCRTGCLSMQMAQCGDT